MKKILNRLLNKILLFNKNYNLQNLRNKLNLGANVFISPKAIIKGNLNNIYFEDNVHIEAYATVICNNDSDKIIIGQNTILKSFARIESYGGSVEIGNFCSVNPYTIIYGHGGVKIGNGVRIAALSMIIPANHVFENPDIYIHKQGLTKKGIIIENDVWIGSGVTILDGCIVKTGTIIAAGSVLNRNTNVNDIFVGVPAKKISSRNKNEN